MANFLYTLIIYPLTILIETAYQLVYAIFENVGFSVIGVSVAVSLFCLPLYIVAEAWQETERKKQKEMEPGVARIKKAFKGDEQYMILTTFYKQKRYHPMMALRSSFGLLIQVPFFMAAYTFLSSMPALQGQSFAFIKDMGKPDALFSVANFPINVLPIAMTLINIAGSAVYTRGFKLKEKLPIYAMALIFLTILYDSPAGLVLYWTMNNVFSLVKNVFYKIKRPLFALYILASLAAAAGIFYVLHVHTGLFSKRLVLAAIFALTFFSPLIVKAAAFAVDKPLKALVQSKAARHAVFTACALSLALLTGIVIPSNTITSSVIEFTNIDGIANANHYVFTSFAQALGIFGFWFFCVYFLFSKKIQAGMAAASALFLIWGVVNAFAFGGDYGSISRSLIFDKTIIDSAGAKALNILALLALAAALLCVIKFVKPQNGIIPLSLIFFAALFAISAFNTIKIQKESASLSMAKIQESKKIEKAFHLSQKGKNVVVIMADKAENVYARTILNSYPKLKEAFKDWTLYSHTLSYDSHTLLGAPPLYGGYEYTPLEMNKRDKVPLKEKNNEALLLMPRVFTEQAGFEAQAYDLSWANYSWVSDMSICDPYPKIHGGNLERKYTSKWIEDHPDSVQKNAASKTIERNFLWFSLFKQAPLFLREALYDDGAWWSSDGESNDMMEFISFYSVLDYLPELTDFEGNDKGDFVLLQSMTTHASSIQLQAPDFVPAKKVDDKGKFGEYDEYVDHKGFSVNAVLFCRLAEWMEFLKENGCYDNTRIIVAADHGSGSFNINEPFFFGGNMDAFAEYMDKFPEAMRPAFEGLASTLIDGYNLDCNHPLLMVKDFTDSDGAEKSPREFTVDNSFMTNADVPALAFDGIVQKPVNPWTGKAIERKTENVAQGVVAGGRYDPGKNGIYKYDLNGIKIYDVHDNMADVSNWKERKE